MSVRRFRGLRSAASLKRGRKPEPARDDIEIPRTQIRGLIEAERLRALGAEVEEIPRTQIRGLIEASCRPGSRRLYQARFRGLRSAASLKPAGRAGATGRRLGIPRTQIRGLIEAHALLPVGRGPAEGIPRTQIRGLIEAAGDRQAWRVPTPPIPRTQIRGLIEADTPACHARRSSGRFRGLRSAASLKPRHDPRGRRPGRDSADSDPRPH